MIIMIATVDSPVLGGECGPGGGVLETEDRERLCLTTPTSPLSPDITPHMSGPVGPLLTCWLLVHHPHPSPPTMQFDRW